MDYTLENAELVSDEPATSVAYMPRGDAIVYGNADGGITYHAINSPKTVFYRDARGLEGVAVNAVAVSPESWVAAGRDDGTVQLWDVAGREVPIVPASTASDDAAGNVASQPASITYLSFDREGKRLAAGDSQGMLWQWDLDLGARSAVARHPLTQGDDGIVGFSYGTPSTTVTVVDEAGQVVLWDTEQETRIKEDALKPGAHSVAFPPGGGWPLASGDADGKIYQWIQVWRLFSSEEPLALEVGPVSAGVFADADHLLVGGQDGTVQMCDRTAVPLSCQVVAPELGRINSLALSHDGQLLASANEKGTIFLRNLDGSREAHSLSVRTSVTSLAFSADDQRLIAGVEAPVEVGGVPSTGQIKMWDLSMLPETPKELPPPASGLTMIESLDTKPVGVIRSLAVSREGERVAIAAGGNGITWELGDDAPAIQLTGRARKTRSLAFSPTGSQLASGRSDGWIYLWETENDPTQTAAPIGRLKAPVIALSWRDAQTLVAVGADGLVVEFSLDPGFMKKKACEVVIRDFTADESRRFFGQDDYKVCS